MAVSRRSGKKSRLEGSFAARRVSTVKAGKKTAASERLTAGDLVRHYSKTGQGA